LCRASVGLGEGVAPSASTDMIARLVRTSERSRATSYMFGGLHVGSLLGLLVAPPLIERFGWQTVRALRPPHRLDSGAQHLHALDESAAPAVHSQRLGLMSACAQ
jgi:hypothetical protein